MKAMILAAGKGERMRPLTLKTPKPLLEVNGKPLIVWHLEKLSRAGIADVVINVSWLGDIIMNTLGNGSFWGINIHYSREETPLETAGGIRKALPLLGDEHFLVVNGDIFTDFDFSSLIKQPLRKDAHVVLTDNPPQHPQGDFSLRGELITNKTNQSFTFAGISLLSKRLINNYDPNEQKLGALLHLALKEQKVSGELYTGEWHDVGTPERLEALNTLKIK